MDESCDILDRRKAISMEKASLLNEIISVMENTFDILQTPAKDNISFGLHGAKDFMSLWYRIGWLESLKFWSVKLRFKQQLFAIMDAMVDATTKWRAAQDSKRVYDPKVVRTLRAICDRYDALGDMERLRWPVN